MEGPGARSCVDEASKCRVGIPNCSACQWYTILPPVCWEQSFHGCVHVEGAGSRASVLTNLSRASLLSLWPLSVGKVVLSNLSRALWCLSPLSEGRSGQLPSETFDQQWPYMVNYYLCYHNPLQDELCHRLWRQQRVAIETYFHSDMRGLRRMQ